MLGGLKRSLASIGLVEHIEMAHDLSATMKIAAYQVPLDATSSMDVVRLLYERVKWCESEGVEMLCCPEGVLGGLADYAAQPTDIAINVKRGGLGMALAPLASDRVTTIMGFSE